jgi:hypothetical protein
MVFIPTDSGQTADDARVAQPRIVDIPGMPGEVNLAASTASHGVKVTVAAESLAIAVTVTLAVPFGTAAA